MSFSDETLMAYADGELEPAARAEVESAMRGDPEVAARVARHQALRTDVFAAFAPVLDEPVPARLSAAAKGGQWTLPVMAEAPRGAAGEYRQAGSATPAAVLDAIDARMKAGLVDKKKVKAANQEKSKQHKIELRTGVEKQNESREAALEAQRKLAERNARTERPARRRRAQKAIAAQIAQMVQTNRQPKGNGDIAYNFTIGTKIERIHVSEKVREHLVAGRLAIVSHGGGFELVPRVIADKIAERAPEIVVRGGQQGRAAGGGGRRSLRRLQDPGRPDVVISPS
jgi:uncharacterized protein YaiL (DUF2058 family)